MSRQSEDSSSFFTKMVDELVEFAEHDPELKELMQWADGEAFRKGKTFYDMIYEMLYAHDVREKAKEWLDKRKSSISLDEGIWDKKYRSEHDYE